ncbi:hypothetical protein ACQKTA_08740 [Enterococcus sp. 22-H-5-01]|uniref:hypothetical protein n=1 Tax=Enterococcus sp. 22-H-5-01 TaxID=3418555 RepID=UPI003CFE315D
MGGQDVYDYETIHQVENYYKSKLGKFELAFDDANKYLDMRRNYSWEYAVGFKKIFNIIDDNKDKISNKKDFDIVLNMIREENLKRINKIKKGCSYHELVAELESLEKNHL